MQHAERPLNPSNGSNGGGSADDGELNGAAVTRKRYNVYGNNESNYWYQLQRFVSDLKVLEGEGPSGGAPGFKEQARVQAAMREDAHDAVSNMQLVDAVYRAAGLPLRLPAAEYRAQ